MIETWLGENVGASSTPAVAPSSSGEAAPEGATGDAQHVTNESAADVKAKPAAAAARLRIVDAIVAWRSGARPVAVVPNTAAVRGADQPASTKTDRSVETAHVDEDADGTA